MWKSFLDDFNGKCFFIEEKRFSNETLCLYTDASGSKGYGAVFKNSWFAEKWNYEWKGQNIEVLKLYPIALAVEILGLKWQISQYVFTVTMKPLFTL